MSNGRASLKRGPRNGVEVRAPGLASRNSGIWIALVLMERSRELMDLSDIIRAAKPAMRVLQINLRFALQRNIGGLW